MLINKDHLLEQRTNQIPVLINNPFKGLFKANPSFSKKSGVIRLLVIGMEQPKKPTSDAHVLLRENGDLFQFRPFDICAGNRLASANCQPPQINISHTGIEASTIFIDMITPISPGAEFAESQTHHPEFAESQIDSLIDLGRGLVVKYNLIDVISIAQCLPKSEGTDRTMELIKKVRVKLGFGDVPNFTFFSNKKKEEIS